MAEQTMYEIPVPDDLSTIRAIHDGQRWINGVVRAEVRNGTMYFDVQWGRKNHDTIRRFMLSTDLIGGYQCDGR